MHPFGTPLHTLTIRLERRVRFDCRGGSPNTSGRTCSWRAQFRLSLRVRADAMRSYQHGHWRPRMCEATRSRASRYGFVPEPMTLLGVANPSAHRPGWKRDRLIHILLNSHRNIGQRVVSHEHRTQSSRRTGRHRDASTQVSRFQRRWTRDRLSTAVSIPSASYG